MNHFPTGLVFGASTGFAAGLLPVAGNQRFIYQFERRSLKPRLINGG